MHNFYDRYCGPKSKAKNNFPFQDNYVAKYNLGEVKLERVGLCSSPFAVGDMRGDSLGSYKPSLGVCSWCCIALLLCLLIIVDQL